MNGEDEGMTLFGRIRPLSIALAIHVLLASLLLSPTGQAEDSLQASLDYSILDGPYNNTIPLNGSAADARAAVDRNSSSPYYGTIYVVSDTSHGYCVDGICAYDGNLTFHRSLDGGKSFEGPHSINLCSASGTTYCRPSRAAPDIAVGNEGVVYAATLGTVLYSEDRGVSWQTSAAIGELVTSSSIAAGNVTGTIYVAGVNSSNVVLVTRSLDRGQTWSSPSAIPNRTTTATPQIATFRDSVMVAFLSGSKSPAPVAVAASQDGGLTWTTTTDVSPSTLCLGFSPSAAVSPDGTFAVSWEAAVSPSGCYGQTAATFVSISWDRGRTFAAPIEVGRHETGAGLGFGDALVFDDRDRLFVTWNGVRWENGLRGSVFVGYANIGEPFSTASFSVMLQGGGANGTSYQHLAAGFNGRIYLTWFDFIGGDEQNAATFFRGVSGEASGDVVPGDLTVSGTAVNVELVDPGTGSVQARTTWTGSPIVLPEVPPDVYHVWIQVPNASALAGAMPVLTWNRTAFTVHLQVVGTGPGPTFPWTIVAAAGGIVIVASAGLLALQHTRLAREDILQRKVRLLTYETIRGHPGSSFTEVRDAIGLKNGVAAYHLGVLEKQGLIHSEKGRRHRWYYPNGDVSLWRDLPLSPMQRAVLQTVRDAPGIGIRELARSLNRRHGSVAYNVKGLAREGLLRTQRAGRKVQCFTTDDRGPA